MKKFSFKKIFINNWQIKLACLLVAVGFWTYVSSTGVKVDNFPGGVSLELQNVPEGMVAITDVENVDLKIVAEKNVWSKLSSDSVKAYVDLAGLDAGTHELGIRIQINVEGVEVEDYSPQQALTRLESKITKEVPVNVKIEGNAADGLVSGVPIVEPEEVEISGAKSVIDKILEANAVVRLDGETEEVNKKVKLVALNAENENISGVTFDPQEVDVTVPIVKAEDTKTVGIKVQTTGNLADGYWISQITTSPSTATITGNSSILKSINYLETASINIDNLSEDLSTNIEINTPSGVSLVDQINSVAVNLTIAKIDTQKQVNPSIDTKNLSNNLKIKSLNPSSMSVNIEGDTDTLQSISDSDIKLEIDLSGYNIPGSYPIDITKNMFNTPENISVLSFTPSSITVELETK